jgi:hypothetical protein
MTKDDINTDQPLTRWFIDSNWFSERGRSISALLWGCLCDDCRKELSKEVSPTSETELLNRIRGCCHKSASFITGQMPVMESLFRLFIAGGNEPMTVEELGSRLSERRGGDASRTSEEVMLRLLQNDRYYGFRPAAD